MWKSLTGIIIVVIQYCQCTEFDLCSDQRNCEIRMKFGWKCENAKCVKTAASTVGDGNITSADACNVICNPEAGSLWPKPTMNTSIRGNMVSVKNIEISFNYADPGKNSQLRKLLEELEHYATAITDKLYERSNRSRNKGVQLDVSLHVNNSDTTLDYETNESYHLSIKMNDDNVLVASITGNTYFGVRHGVETLLQLIVYDEFSNSVQIPSAVDIADQPMFAHRGIMLKTGRYFHSVKKIKMILDAMALNKFNVLHWRITDRKSFPYLSIRYPDMASHGAFSKSMVYTCDDIQAIVHYALVRGIRVMPALDLPGHTSQGWQFFNDKDNGDVVLCSTEVSNNICPEAPCGALNPLNKNVYTVLKHLFAEYKQLFKSDLFHIGGDDDYVGCWNSQPEIKDWSINKKINNVSEVWNYFYTRTLRTFDQTSKSSKKEKIVIWSNDVTLNGNLSYLDKTRNIIQITSDDYKGIGKWLQNGFRLILSQSYRMNCGYEHNDCPYVSWKTMYGNNPTDLFHLMEKNGVEVPKDAIHQILGMEAIYSKSSMDGQIVRFWPRSAVVAERSWTNPTSSWELAKDRYYLHRERMIARGIEAEVISPLYCFQNQKQC